MAAFNKFNCFVVDLAKKVHDLGSDDLRIALSNVAPVATNTVFANITEITAQNGYSAGGVGIDIASCVQAAGVLKLVLVDAYLPGNGGGGYGPWQYAVLYNNTPVSKPLIAWFDRGSPITIAAGQPFVFDFDETNGVLTIT